jgi:hypothetical protein
MKVPFSSRSKEDEDAPLGKKRIEFIEVLDLRHRHEIVQPSELAPPSRWVCAPGKNVPGTDSDFVIAGNRG